MRIKASVKNPSYVSTSAGIKVELLSSYANYIYEEFSLAS